MEKELNGMRFIWSAIGLVFAITGGTLFIQGHSVVALGACLIGAGLVMYQQYLSQKGK